MKIFNRSLPHLLSILGFVVISIVFFYPVLQNKALEQSDIVQYTGMAREQNEFRANEHTEPFWTNAAFGGMPTYQLGANYPHNYIKQLDGVLRFLPRPADYLFLYFLGFYGLLLVLRTDPLKAFFGALAFGLSTYFIIILGVGHNAKAHAIAYMPLVVAGTLLVFRRRYVYGGLLTMLAVALEINANHFQMTYYLLILLLAIAVYYFWDYAKAKAWKPLGIALATLAGAVVLAVGANATGLLATAEYTSFSMRSKSDLSFKPDGQKHEATSMPREYITQYSYGIPESFNLIAPGLFGGSNGEKVDKDSKSVEYLQTPDAQGQAYSPEDAARIGEQGLPLYWGDQPGVAAPAYIGVIVFFLCALGLYADNRKIKYAFLAGAIVSLMLSWGKNFPALTDFFIDHVPMYDKFRAVSSIQVVLELCAPVLAVMGLQSFFQSDKEKQLKSLMVAAGVALGLLLALLACKGMFTFRSENDRGMDPGLIDALVQDRKALYSSDLWRSILLVLAAAAVLWLHTKEKLSAMIAVILVGVLMVGDLLVVDKKYVNADKFVDKYKMEHPFEPSLADQEILKDKSDYRVYDIQGRMQAKASYFHKSIGGYSAVRPRRLDEVIDYQIDPKLKDLAGIIDAETLGLKMSIPALDLLNVKYLIVATRDGELPVTNPFAYGSAWFVSAAKTVNSADDEMRLLASPSLKNIAVVNAADQKGLEGKTFGADSTATIKLQVSKPNYLKYQTQNTQPGLAVFSEMYYPKGWNAYVDGKLTPHFRADYVLRAMELPAGTHAVEFKFEPQVVKTGSMISLASSLVMLLLLAGGIYIENKKNAASKAA